MRVAVGAHAYRKTIERRAAASMKAKKTKTKQQTNKLIDTRERQHIIIQYHLHTKRPEDTSCLAISAAIATSAAPYSDNPELPTCPTCDLETPATHAQAHAGLHSKIWGAARAPDSADGIAASAKPAEPATNGNIPSATSVGGAVGARESSAGAVPSDAATEAAPSTDGITAPAASTAREARALASAAGSDGEICGERGASTHPFDPGTVCPLEVHYYNGSWL